MKIYYILLLIIVNLAFLRAQNLISNPSFEELYERENDENNDYHVYYISDLKNWINPTYGTPDYLSNNNNGYYYTTYQSPRTGSAYIGIKMGPDKHKEYIQTKLITPLKKGGSYCISLYLCLHGKYSYAIKEMTVALTKNRIKSKTADLLRPKSEVIYLSNGNFLTNIINWEIVCQKYTAKGGEKYLTIGNFGKLSYLKLNYLFIPNKSSNSKRTYYFIDDVSIVEIQDESECNCNVIKQEQLYKIEPPKNLLENNIEPGQTIILNNVYFEFDKSELLPESYKELDKLYNYLKNNIYKRIEISGHTDNIGNKRYNLKLSKERAKAVAKYLISKGINENIIKYKGYGSSHPIATNETEGGRSKNRRVEFFIKK